MSSQVDERNSSQPQAASDLARNDPLDETGGLILELVRQAAGSVNDAINDARDRTERIAQQVRAAEERIRELEADVRYHQDRADRAEKWLHHISSEIEHRFLRRDQGSTGGAPTPQGMLRSARRRKA